MSSSIQQLATTTPSWSSFVVHQPYLIPVDGEMEESFLVIFDEGGVDGHRRGRRGRVLRIDGAAIAAAKANSGEGMRT